MAGLDALIEVASDMDDRFFRNAKQGPAFLDIKGSLLYAHRDIRDKMRSFHPAIATALDALVAGDR